MGIINIELHSLLKNERKRSQKWVDDLNGERKDIMGAKKKGKRYKVVVTFRRPQLSMHYHFELHLMIHLLLLMILIYRSHWLNTFVLMVVVNVISRQ